MMSLRKEAADRGVSLWQVRKERGEPQHRPGRLCVRLPALLHEQLRVAAEERDVSVTWLITKAVEDLLEHLLPAEEIRWTRNAD